MNAYLGHVISEHGIKPDNWKIKSVLEFPKLTYIKNIKSFLGLSVYYRKCVQGHSAISELLTNLLKKDIKFTWSDDCQKSFDKLKAAFCSEPILKHTDFNITNIKY